MPASEPDDMELPSFRYHPDPYGSGVVVGADAVCECCGEARGLFYTGPFYARQEIENLCLWCVADGSAAEKFDGEFVDSHSLAGEGLAETVIAEVTRRTPSFSAWQQEQWLTHCNDACAYRGYPTEEEVRSASDEMRLEWARHHDLEPGDWETAVSGFATGHAGFYKFCCLHCDRIFLATDWA